MPGISRRISDDDRQHQTPSADAWVHQFCVAHLQSTLNVSMAECHFHAGHQALDFRPETVRDGSLAGRSRQIELRDRGDGITSRLTSFCAVEERAIDVLDPRSGRPIDRYRIALAQEQSLGERKGDRIGLRIVGGGLDPERLTDKPDDLPRDDRVVRRELRRCPVEGHVEINDEVRGLRVVAVADHTDHPGAVDRRRIGKDISGVGGRGPAGGVDRYVNRAGAGGLTAVIVVALTTVTPVAGFDPK